MITKIHHKYVSRIVVEMRLLLGLYLRNAFNVVLVMEIGAASSECVHACLYADGFELGAVEVIS